MLESIYYQLITLFYSLQLTDGLQKLTNSLQLTLQTPKSPEWHFIKYLKLFLQKITGYFIRSSHRWSNNLNAVKLISYRPTYAIFTVSFTSFRRQKPLTLSVSTALRILSQDLSWTICSHLWIEDLNQLWKPVRANILASLLEKNASRFNKFKAEEKVDLISSLTFQTTLPCE